MNTRLQLPSRPACGWEILAQPATFLPVETMGGDAGGQVCARELRHLDDFLPILDFNRKKVTLAQPLLKEMVR